MVQNGDAENLMSRWRVRSAVLGVSFPAFPSGDRNGIGVAPGILLGGLWARSSTGTLPKVWGSMH